jgi:hypothetical protein
MEKRVNRQLDETGIDLLEDRLTDIDTDKYREVDK